MAQALVPIQTITVGSGGSSSIEFTNIPQSYTDLYLVTSLRTNQNAVIDGTLVRFNSDTNNSNYTARRLYGNGSSATGDTNNLGNQFATGTTATSNTFGISSLYICDYAVTNKEKSYISDNAGEHNGVTTYRGVGTQLWSNQNAITSIKLTPESGTTFDQHSTATLYGIGAQRASGGTITADSQYTYHTFTSSGTFTALEKIKGAQILVIAGGAGGGSDGSGGGGAGGVAYAANRTLNAGTSYSAIVGAGSSGILTTGTATSNGSNSFFTNITAFGGGAPGMGTGTGNYYYGYAGGSGGGVRGNRGAATGGSATQTSTLDIIGYGNSGGSSTGGAQVSSTGGGGAGSAGLSANTNGIGSHGGDGTSLFSNWAIATGTGVAGFYAGGGGAGGNSAQGGTGGRGGGGRGAGTADAATSGTANTGSGGGGTDGGGGAFGNTVGNGGSGIVIIRYPN